VGRIKNSKIERKPTDRKGKKGLIEGMICERAIEQLTSFYDRQGLLVIPFSGKRLQLREEFLQRFHPFRQQTAANSHVLHRPAAAGLLAVR